MVIFNYSYCVNIYILELYLVSFWVLVRSLGLNWLVYLNLNMELVFGLFFLVLVYIVEGIILIWLFFG